MNRSRKWHSAQITKRRRKLKGNAMLRLFPMKWLVGDYRDLFEGLWVIDITGTCDP
jgi:hypothetical protein